MRPVSDRLAEVLAREAAHFDRQWSGVPLCRVTAQLHVPGIKSLRGKRILICSCGSGDQPVMAANAGAEVYAVDISAAGIEKARQMAEFNNVKVRAEIMDLHQLSYPDDFFDVMFGSAVLHHLDCVRAGAEFYRCLKPGGLAYFAGENSDRNCILRFFYRALGHWGVDGKPKKYLFFQRTGTPDERMLCEADIEALRRYFGNTVQVTVTEFMFFRKLSHVIGRRMLGLTAALDALTGKLFPFLRRYSYDQNILLQKRTCHTDSASSSQISPRGGLTSGPRRRRSPRSAFARISFGVEMPFRPVWQHMSAYRRLQALLRMGDEE
jgi:ubiquinone/menaquinone biosynthesis C-methylase UbiE